MSRRSSALLVLTTLALLWATVAAAAPRSAALSWVRAAGAESCITLPELATRVEKRVSGLSFVPAAEAEINVEGSIARTAAGWAATLVISDAGGQVLGRRELASNTSDCRSIDDALVLVIALALDPNQEFVSLPDGFAGEIDPGEALLSELRAQPPQRAAPAVAAAQPSPPSAAPAPQASESGLSFEIGAELRAIVGLVPQIGVGATAHGRIVLVPADWAFELRIGGVLPRAAEPEGGGVVEIGALQAALGVCSPAFSSFRGCAGVAPGALTLDAQQLSAAHDTLRPIVNLYAAIELAYRFGTAGLVARLGAEVPLIRDQIQVLDPDGHAKPAYKPAAVAGSLELGAFVHFGS